MKINCIGRLFRSDRGNGVVRQYRRAKTAWNLSRFSDWDFGVTGYGCRARLFLDSPFLKKMDELQPSYDSIVARARAIREYNHPKDSRFYILER